MKRGFTNGLRSLARATPQKLLLLFLESYLCWPIKGAAIFFVVDVMRTVLQALYKKMANKRCSNILFLGRFSRYVMSVHFHLHIRGILVSTSTFSTNYFAIVNHCFVYISVITYVVMTSIVIVLDCRLLVISSVVSLNTFQAMTKDMIN